MTARRRAAGNDARGFTLVELMVATAIMVGITGVIFALVNPSRGTYRVQPEVSDMQQRLRVGTTFMANDMLMAGAGAPAGSGLGGSLMNYFAPIQPVRLGVINPDIVNGVLYRPDAVTVMYVPAGSPQTTLEYQMPQPSAELQIGAVPSCFGTSNAIGCDTGFREGMRVLIFDNTGSFDDVAITQVQPGAGGASGVEGMLQHNKSMPGQELTNAYGPGAQVAQVMQRTYYWDQNTLQLKYYDGYLTDEAVVDNVVGLQFEYYGDPRPAVIITGPSGTQWTTYGPLPPPLGVVRKRSKGNAVEWPAGENCMFLVDPTTGQHAPRLPDLAPGSQGLVLLPPATLTDGPFCPDPGAENRFDADLLRVRKIGIRLRVQVASADLRGPAGLLFSNGGTANAAQKLVPDQEIRFEITPRNFNLGR